MKFFFIVGLFTAFLLGMILYSGALHDSPPLKKVPNFMLSYKREMASHFESRETLNVLFAIVTGNKNGISPYTKKAFKKTNLSFLLSPSGVHLAGVLMIFSFLIKMISSKLAKRSLRIFFLISIMMTSQAEAIKRLVGFRLVSQMKFLTKIRMSNEMTFFGLFIVSFLCGGFKASPLGFIYSFAFLGTFLSLRDFSKLTLILGLYLIQLIIALFMGEKVSLISIPIGLLGSYVFSFLFPVILLFLATFWLIKINWIEPLLSGFIEVIQRAAKLLNGSFTSSSIFIILGVTVLLAQKNYRGKHALVGVLFFLHTNTAMTPSIFS